MNYIKKFLAITLIFVMQFQSVHASVAIGGGWSLNLTRVENSTNIFTAFKNGFQSTVAISPSSAQVAKSLLRGGLVGLALSAVTQVLEDGVDYLLDSANQELRYTPKPVYQYNPSRYYPSVPGCESSTVTFKTLEEAMSWGRYCINWSIENNHQIQKILKTTYNSITYLNVFNTEETMTVREEKNSSQRKSIPLTTLATQIINLAEQGNPDAKAYITSVVQDMLEHDEEYRKSLEAQLDAKLKEAQSIGSNNGNNNNGGNSNSGNNSATKPVPSTSGNSTTANPTPPNNDDDEDQRRIDNVLKDTQPGRKTKGRTIQYVKKGGFERANKDFDSLGLRNIRNIDGGRLGQLRDGTYVNVRSYSSYQEPTLEIRYPKPIKIRYEP